MTEVERRNYEYCRNVAHGRETNFQRITASPEALAEFLLFADGSLCRTCQHWTPSTGCMAREEDKCLLANVSSANQFADGTYECWLAWLKQESDSE